MCPSFRWFNSIPQDRDCWAASRQQASTAGKLTDVCKSGVLQQGGGAHVLLCLCLKSRVDKTPLSEWHALKVETCTDCYGSL